MKHNIVIILTALAVLSSIDNHVFLLRQIAVLHAQTKGVPVFEPHPSWLKVPAKWKLGDVSSVAVDEQDHVWVLHRPRTLPADQAGMAAPPVLEFDQDGNFIQAWGGQANGYEWPQREHGIYVDYQGHVWIGGNYCPARKLPGLKPVFDDQLVKFTKTGKFVMQIGQANKSTGNADTNNLHEPADTVVYRKTNELFVADGYGNHRVVVFDAVSGKFKRMWGAFGNRPIDRDFCPSAETPRPSQADDAGLGPQQFDIVHTLRVSNDGLVYVGDRENRRVQVFTLDGKYITQARRSSGFAGSLSLSADPAQQFLYVSGSPGIVVLDRKTLKDVHSITGNGMLGGGHHMTVDSRGNIYTAQLGRGVQKLVFKGLR